MKQKYILISSLLSCIGLYFIEQVLGVNYALKTVSKLILFMIIPYIYIKLLSKSSIATELNLKKIDKKGLNLGFCSVLLHF